MPSLTRRGALVAAGGALAAGCLGIPGAPRATRDPDRHPYDLSVSHDLSDWPRYDPDWSPPADPAPESVAVETVVENLEIPWDLSFTADGSVFVSERTGRILHYGGEDLSAVASPGDIIDAGSIPTDVKETVWWVEGGEGGLLGIEAHPTYPDPPVVYAYYTYDVGEEKFNKLVYFDVDADDPGAEPVTLIDGIAGSTIHNGSRLAFGPENYLWVTVGDGGESALAADPRRLPGSILRLAPDGTAPPDNPDAGDPRVYTYGHRNPQGITWLPDGTPVATEHGPTGKDEVNRLVAGGNYGWPHTREAGEYRDSQVVAPLLSTGSDSWAPSGCVFATAAAPDGLANRLLVGALATQEIRAVTIAPADGSLPEGPGVERHDAGWLDPDFVAASQSLLRDVLGRVRHVEQAPDGTLYAITSNRDGRSGPNFPREGDDRLVRLSTE